MCPANGNSVASPGWRLIVRLVLDITRTRDGRYEGRLTVAGTGSQHDFSGILELLAILEEHLGPEDVPQTEPGYGTGPGRITGETDSP
jgi:hypothetical protein